MDTSVLIIKGSQTTTLPVYTIINNSELKWCKGSKVEIRIPLELLCNWQENDIFLNIGKKDFIKIKPHYIRNSCIFNLPQEILFKREIRIKGLAIRNTYTPCKPTRLLFFVNEDKCDYSAGEKDFRKFVCNNVNPFKKQLAGTIGIADVRIQLGNDGKYILNNGLLGFPEISITTNGLNSLIPRGTTLEIIFPEPLNSMIVKNKARLEVKNLQTRQIWNLINKKQEYSKKELVLWESGKKELKARIELKKDFNKLRIVLKDIGINTDLCTLSPTTLKLKMSQKEIPLIETSQTISIANPKIDLDDDLCLIMNSPPDSLQAITIEPSGWPGAFTDINNVYLKLPDNTGLFWDNSVRYINIEGEGSHKIDPKISYKSEQILKINLIKDFEGNEKVKIRGLKVGLSGKKSHLLSENENIYAYLYGDNNKNGLYQLDKQISMAVFSIKSKSKQVFCMQDLPKTIEEIVIELKSNHPILKLRDTLIIKIPDEMPLEWSINQKYTSYDKKVISNIIYLSPKMLGLSLNTGLEDGSKIRVKNLEVCNFTKQGSGKIELLYGIKSPPIATDVNEWVISAPIFTMSSDQKVYIGVSENVCYQLIIKTSGLNKYLAANDRIYIKIPTDFPLSFAVNQKGTRVEKNMASLETATDKVLTFRILATLQKDAQIKISGIEFSEPTGTTQDICYLLVSIKDNPFEFKNQKQITIAEFISKCSKSEYIGRLAESNFTPGDTIFLALEGSNNISFDLNKTLLNLKIKQPRGIINLNQIIQTKGNKELGFIISKNFNPNESIRFIGLYLTVAKPIGPIKTPGHTFLKIKYKDLYGNQEVKYHLPICYLNMVGGIEPPASSLESYPYPLIEFNNAGQDSLRKPYNISEICLPDFSITNGDLSYTDYKEYLRINNLPIFIKVYIDSNNTEKVKEIAADLVKECPDFWYGYWALATALKLEGRIDEARRNREKAKVYGYISSVAYPDPVPPNIYEEDLRNNITEGIKLFGRRSYLEAEKKFLRYLEYEEQLISDNKKYLLGQAIYWAGRVSMELHDCEYAKKQYELAKYYDYLGPSDDYSKQVNYLLEKCHDEEVISQSPPINIKPLHKALSKIKVTITFYHPDRKEEKIKIVDKIGNHKLKGKYTGKELQMNNRGKYVIKYPTIKNAMLSVTGVIFFGTLICGLLLM